MRQPMSMGSKLQRLLVIKDQAIAILAGKDM
jgi:hypothetical protein